MKREVNGKRKLKQQTPQKVDQLTVQRLSSDVSGKAQKFSRIGPREFVSYPYGDLTMEGIKKACEAHFLSQLKMHAECDVLAGEQGPSCSSLDQIPNLKLIHIRFVGTTVKSSLHSYTLASPSFMQLCLSCFTGCSCSEKKARTGRVCGKFTQPGSSGVCSNSSTSRGKV